MVLQRNTFVEVKFQFVSKRGTSNILIASVMPWSDEKQGGSH